MSLTRNHEDWMSQALRLAKKGRYSTHPNPRVGCLVVKNEQLIAEGWHEVSGGPHAEIGAINSTSIEPGSDFYVTLEPCSHHGKTGPCVDALIKLRPRRVIIAMQDPNPLVAGQGIEKLHRAGIDVICGVLTEQARDLNQGFVSRFEKQRPFLRLKMATSLDGRTALKNGDSQWITGVAARRDVQFLRAASSAILTSAATVLSDNPRLNVRLSAEDLNQAIEVRQPIKVIVDSKLRLSGEEKVFEQAGPVWIYTVSHDQSKHQRLREAGAKVILLNANNSNKIDLKQMMADLAAREINEVHTECGQGLAGALLNQDLVDEIVIYMAPIILGSQALGGFDIGQLTDMNNRYQCKIKQTRQIGSDLRITLIPEIN